jgi:hypothetical protein
MVLFLEYKYSLIVMTRVLKMLCKKTITHVGGRHQTQVESRLVDTVLAEPLVILFDLLHT